MVVSVRVRSVVLLGKRFSPRGCKWFANHCILFLTKIWMAVHPIDRPRSSALDGPPAIDMCAPSNGIDLSPESWDLLSGWGLLLDGIEPYCRIAESNSQIGWLRVPTPWIRVAPPSRFPAKSS